VYPSVERLDTRAVTIPLAHILLQPSGMTRALATKVSGRLAAISKTPAPTLTSLVGLLPQVRTLVPTLASSKGLESRVFHIRNNLAMHHRLGQIYRLQEWLHYHTYLISHMTHCRVMKLRLTTPIESSVSGGALMPFVPI
jgi:hypothetical protein